MISLPETNNKIAILFTGGMESYLLGKLCIQKYGAESVVFVMWNMDEYNIFYKNNDKRNKVKLDFHKSVINVGGSITFVIDNDMYQTETGYLAPRTITIIRKQFPDVDFIMGGYNNIHRESYEILQKINVESNTNNVFQKGRLEVFSNKDQYPELIEFLTQCDGMIYFVEEDFTMKSPKDLISFIECKEIHAPFYMLTKTDIVNLYVKLGLQEELYKTISCNKERHNMHCGVCRNCLARKVAIKNAKIEDKTVYLC